jgi:hypothetical protein
MNTFLKNTLKTGVPFGIFIGIYQGIQPGPPGPWWGPVSGAVGGALFGVTMAAFLRSQAKRATVLREEFAAEGLVLDAGANLGGAGGWLFLTKQRLVFIAHKYNVGTKSKRVEIALPTIAALRELTGLRRGVEVGTTNAERYTFVVEHREKWIEALSTAVTNAGGCVRTLAS